METVEDVARMAIAEAASPASALFASQYVNYRYKELAARFRLKSLKSTVELQLIADYDTGTVTATRDSTTVTGTTTAWTPALEGRYFRGSTAWYRVAQVQSTTSLILETPFSEDTITDSDYTIVKRFYALPRSVKHVDRIWTLQRLRRKVYVISKEDLDRLAPERNTLNFPRWTAETGIDYATQGRVFELYPYTDDESELITIPCWTEPQNLGFKEPLPGYLNGYVLKEGVIASLWRRDGIQMIRDGNAAGGQLVLNESRRQENLWRGKMIEAILDEGAIDDASVVIHRGGRTQFVEDPITTAYDQVWSS